MEEYYDIFYTSFSSWVQGVIFILSIYTFLIYTRIKDQSFLYYSLYAFLLCIHLLTRSPNVFYYPETIFTEKFIYYTNWPIQFTYYLIYTQFIRDFFSLKKVNPTLDSYIKNMIRIMAILCIAYSLLNYFVLSTSHHDYLINAIKFIILFFIPIYIPFVIYIFIKLTYLKNPTKHLFIAGSTIFISSSIFAFYLVVTKTQSAIPPIAYLMTGAIIETLFFAIGLGVKVNLISVHKNKYQRQLIEQLKENKKLIEHHNTILTKEIQQKTKEIEIFTKKELEIKFRNQIDKLKTQVYSSQMNSHFVFNSLNSIKSSIINDKKIKSIEQLNKFSKLMRSTLSNSLLEEISLSEELEATHLYFYLENSRLSDQITFDVMIEELPISISEIKIPPFIFQPFIENAIWHGLATKNGDKKLELKIVSTQDDIITVIIKDNGIGMIKSNALKQKKHIKHESMGIKITKERLELFTKNKKEKFTLNFENIGSQKNSEGTMVTINLPVG